MWIKFNFYFQKVTRKNNTLPLWGNKTSMNLNSLVLENIVNSPYYKTALTEMTTFNEVVNEIYYNVRFRFPKKSASNLLSTLKLYV